MVRSLFGCNRVVYATMPCAAGLAGSRCSVDVAPCRPHSTPVDRDHLSPVACHVSLNHYLYSLDRSSKQWLLLEHRISRPVGELCLVCRVRCSYALPIVLGVGCASVVSTCSGTCVCSTYSMTLVVNCGAFRIVRRLCRSVEVPKIRL